VSKLTVRNDGSKTVYTVDWACSLHDPASGAEVARYYYHVLSRIKPGQTNTFSVGADVLKDYPEHREVSQKYTPRKYQVRVFVTRVGYTDLTAWRDPAHDTYEVEVAAGPGAGEAPSLRMAGDGGAPPAPATPQPAVPAEIDDGEVLKVETRLVNVPVSAFDEAGRFVPDMREDEFRVYEEGVEQKIASFSRAEQPFTVVLLLDTSQSTGWTLEELKRQALAFVDMLRPGDQMLAVAFAATPHALHPRPTDDREVLRRAISGARQGPASRSTSLYDAVAIVNERVLRRLTGRKAVILFTDGQENSSQVATRPGTLREAEELDALVYAVQYSFKPPHVESDYLKALTEKTGGRLFGGNDGPKIAAAFAAVAEELRRQYVISYYPAAAPAPGQLRRVAVRSARPGTRALTRKQYAVRH
jgi:Ca-activated chloride channel family protein